MFDEKTAFILERREVARFMARLYERGLTTAGGGNISMRLPGGLFCITPTSLDKSRLRAVEIAIVTLEGENLTPDNKLSIETEMHRRILLQRPDINAVVHAHPVYATSFTALDGNDASCPIDTHISAEGYYLLRNPLVVPYAKQGTVELAKKVAEASGKADVLLLQNHGIVTVADTLLLAFEKMDVLERAAQMTTITRGMEAKGFTYRPLTDAQRNELES
ncbi:MAG: class II aldolase/adducin family protein [Sphaerochaeta sp.]|jgi:L-fuculose-phosphate aldolase|nr:class II aldolase/adducin family protein [Sphaerochaeta sp.]